MRYAVHFEHGLPMIFLQDSVCLSAVSLSRQRHDILDFSCCPLSRVLHVFHLRLSTSAFGGYEWSVDQLITSLFATSRDPTTSKQLSTVTILGFQFELYHVVVPLSFLRSISLASFFCFCWFSAPAMSVFIWMCTSMACLHTNLYKFELKIYPDISLKKTCCDLNLGESLRIFAFFLFPGFWILSIERFWFLFWSILNGVTLKTNNSHFIKNAIAYFLGGGGGEVEGGGRGGFNSLAKRWEWVY